MTENPLFASGSLVVCADDFGLHSAVDDAVLQLACAGRLNATSCLVMGQSFARNAAALRDTPGLQRGLHLNFTEALSDAGLYLPLPRLILLSYLRRLDSRQVRLQVARQLDAFHDTLGTAPDFIDGHQHVHQFPQIRQALFAELQRRYGSLPAGPVLSADRAGLVRPWLRSTLARSLGRQPVGLARKAWVIQTLGGAALARQAMAAGYRTNLRFLGVYDFTGGEAGYRQCLARWLALACDGDLLMCHPATEAVPGDVLGAQRVAEYRVLSSPGC